METGDQNFGMRIYNSDLGMFLSVDPFASLINNKSPYNFAGNSPIAFIDKNGGFQISPETAAKYPKLNNVLKSLSNAVNKNPTLSNPLILNFMQAAGMDCEDQCALEEVLEILSYGSGPMIVVGNTTNAFAEYTDGDKFITISNRFAYELEHAGTYVDNRFVKGTSRWLANKVAMLFTVWHEGIHYADYWSDNITIPKEGDPTVPDAPSPGRPDGELDVGDYGVQNLLGYPLRSTSRIRRDMQSGNRAVPIFGGNLNTRNVIQFFSFKGLNNKTHLRRGRYVFSGGTLNNNKTPNLMQKIIQKVKSFFGGESSNGSHTNVRNLED